MRTSPLGGGDILKQSDLPSTKPEVSTNVQNQLSGPADVKAAHSFFQPTGAGGHLPAIPGLGGGELAAAKATEGVAMATAHIAGKLGEGAAISAASQAGAQAISPLVQMIMRMPGHLGLMSSFFEALGHFFMGQDVLNALDPTQLFAQHAESAMDAMHHAVGENVLSADMLFPDGGDAPMAMDSTMPGSEALSSTSVQSDMSFSEAPATGNESLNVSGYADYARPQFEQSHVSAAATNETQSLIPPFMHSSHSMLSDANAATFRPTFGGPNALSNTASPVSQQPIQLPGSNSGSALHLSNSSAQHLLLKQGVHQTDGAAQAWPVHEQVQPQTHTVHHADAANHLAKPHETHASIHHGTDSASAHHQVAHEHALSPKASNLASRSIPDRDMTLNTTDGASHANAPSAQYTIKGGDNLWNIAHDQLGDGSRWGEIFRLNHSVIGDNPASIHAGTNLQLPGGHGEVASADYVVKPGDNLWNISQAHLGGGEHWNQLFHANEAVLHGNPAMLHPGQHLTLSGSPSFHESVASAPAAHSVVHQPHHSLISAPEAAIAPSHLASPMPHEVPIHSFVHQHANVQLASAQPHITTGDTTGQAVPTHGFINSPTPPQVDSIKFTHTAAPPAEIHSQATQWRPELILQNH